jgi:hypothetical protein
MGKLSGLSGLSGSTPLGAVAVAARLGVVRGPKEASQMSQPAKPARPFQASSASRQPVPLCEHPVPARYRAYASTARYVPLRFASGWIIWDRLRGRVADGIYLAWAYVVPLADWYNAHPDDGDRDWLGGTWWSGVFTP